MEWREDVHCVPGNLLICLLRTPLMSWPQSNNDSETTASFSLEAPGMREMVDIAALNSKIKFDKTDVPFEQRAILGDATETGLARFAGKSFSAFEYDEHQKKFPKTFEVPFNSSNKWALVIVSNMLLKAKDPT
jgi:sodium/potassium-transporting ATPase subunit alpha